MAALSTMALAYYQQDSTTLAKNMFPVCPVGLGAFILSMPQRPAVDRLTDYYAKAMMTAPMQWFCRKSGKSKFTAKDIAAMKATAALKAADRNPYSWNMEFYEYRMAAATRDALPSAASVC